MNSKMAYFDRFGIDIDDLNNDQTQQHCSNLNIDVEYTEDYQRLKALV